MKWIAFLAMLAGPAAAQMELGEYPVFDTRFGRLEVGPAADYGVQLSFRGAPVPDLSDASVAVMGAWAIPGEDWDWALVGIAHNGNMCPQRYAILRLSGDGLTQTEQFGACLGPIRDVRVEPGRISVAIEDPEVAVEEQVFAYDGAAFTATSVAASAGAIAGAGDDVLRWVEQGFYALAQDAGERARFMQIMDADALEDLRMRVSVGYPGARVGGWVVGTGCQQHACNEAAGLWAIRVADGQPAAAFFNAGGGERWFGVDPADPAAADLRAPTAGARLP